MKAIATHQHLRGRVAARSHIRRGQLLFISDIAYSCISGKNGVSQRRPFDTVCHVRKITRRGLCVQSGRGQVKGNIIYVVIHRGWRAWRVFDARHPRRQLATCILRSLLPHSLPAVVWLTSACRSLWYSSQRKRKSRQLISNLLLPVPFERLHALVEQIGIDFHEQLQCVVHHSMNCSKMIMSAFLERALSKISHRFQCDFEFR
jgi:hypothetical protein